MILEKIREKGYAGSRSTLSQYIANLRRLQKNGDKPVIRHHRVSPRSASKLLTQQREHVKDDDIPYFNTLLAEVDGASVANELVQSFYILMKTRNGAGLDDWLEKAMSCGIRELRNFAIGMRKDYDAVYAGISQPWSNGQVEGQVNRLKTLKREMYGRASFSLLRARVLSSAL